ncbi:MULTISPECIES: hypothetical protein [Acinetobacter]|jgi:hypothetical protein|uniref:DUF4268 domain-containing protein n=1 Tax=Acinetobacter chengduensis TaxID=2420890 RepID=A0ABX9TSQ7_9GAMM|nr:MULTISPECIES: hypothetical protein [Acinetobacter]MBI1453392.1 hypothetical protein [Acinetobacter sp. FL51]RKG38975.1 hypothetical protein D7V31_14550 [Acinetobacter sp. WCHAc060007]RLL18358.1 hypothetical protein D9K81_15740 [Acinetobacter chengduensis]
MMDNQLEQIRDIWVNAFFIGNYEVLLQYEDEHFKVVYEQDGRTESNFTRYDRIAHAVKNGVWKPKKPDVEFEAYEFDRDQTACKILIGLAENQQQIQELWQFEETWKIKELRFLKQKRAK